MERTILPPGDPKLIENIVCDLKAQGIFDEFRHECLADVDTKPSFQNLSQRVDGYTTKFLANEVWNPDLNKNELRNKLRRHINESGMLNVGIDHVVEQVINAKAQQLFLPRIKEVVEQYLGLRENPFDKEKKKTNISQENGINKEKSNQENAVTSTTFTNENNSDVVPNSSLHISNPKNTNPNLITVKIDTNLIFKNDKNKENTLAPSNKSESTNNSADIDMKSLQDSKEPKLKNIKSPEADLSDNQLKQSKEEDAKHETNKNETFDALLSSENNSSHLLSNKSQNDSKIDSSTRYKYEIKPNDKTNSKPKPQVQHKSSNDQNKIKNKEKGDVVKSSTEKSKKMSSSKIIKNQNKDSASSILALKSNNFTKNSKLEKNADTIQKKTDIDVKTSKTIDLSIKKSQNKMDFSKKEFDNSKNKVISKTSYDKMHLEKFNVHKKNHESSNIIKKKSKIISYSSSYDSSQGSDQEKISKIKEKHFTKHFPKKENISNKNTNKVDNEKKIKAFKNKILDNEQEKLNIIHKDAILTQDSDGSNSYESHSSISSANTAKEISSSNSSDDINDNSSELDKDQKKKPDVKNKKACQVKQLSQTPPPSPPAGNLPCPSSTSDQSSQQESSSDEEEKKIIAKKYDISDAHANVQIKVTKKPNELPNVDARNLFFTSSSDEEFDHFSSPEKQVEESKGNNDYDSDVTVSSVHTSDLSSFEDQLSLSSDEDNNGRNKMNLKKKLTLKEATRFIQKKSENDTVQIASREFDSVCTSSDDCLTKQSSSSIEKESPLPQEPKRALRRERKLNPKYASNEYASIFNSKRKTNIKNSKSSQMKDNVGISSFDTELGKNINQPTFFSNENANATKKIGHKYHDKVEENYQCYSESCKNIDDKTTTVLINKNKDNVELNEIELINPLCGVSTSRLPIALEDLDEASSSSEEIQSIDDITQLQVSINTDSNSENECSLTFSIAKPSKEHHSNNSKKRKSNQGLNSTNFKHLRSPNISEDSTNSDFMTNENKPLNNRETISTHLSPAKGHRFHKSNSDVFRKTTLLRQKFNNSNTFRSSFKKVIIKK